MTIPSEIILPEPPMNLPSEMRTYLMEYTYKLEEVYRDLAQGVNGTYLYANETEGNIYPNRIWRPEVFGATSAGAGTYVHQIGYTVRKGLVTYAFFDVSWSAHTGTGNLYLELPYKVQKVNDDAESTDYKPFVGQVQTDSYTLGSIDYAVVNAIPNTYRLELWSVTTAVATANIAIDTAARIIGSITYLGQEDEA